MALFNQPLASIFGGNTGTPSADTDMGIIQGIILTPEDYEITQADLATLQAKLEADSIATRAARIYPIGPILGNEKQTIEAEFGAYGYGGEKKIKDAIPAYRLQVDGGVGYSKELRGFDNRRMGAMYINEKGLVFGELVAGVLKANKVRVNVNVLDFGTGGEIESILIDIKAQDPSQQNNIGFITPPSDFNPGSISGVLSAELRQIALNETTGVVNVKVLENISKTDLTSLYSTELADEDNWRLIDSDGAPVAGFTATYVAGNETVAINSLIVAAGTYMLTLNLAPTSVLVAAGMNKLESLALTYTFTVPA